MYDNWVLAHENGNNIYRYYVYKTLIIGLTITIGYCNGAKEKGKKTKNKKQKNGKNETEYIWSIVTFVCAQFEMVASVCRTPHSRSCFMLIYSFISFFLLFSVFLLFLLCFFFLFILNIFVLHELSHALNNNHIQQSAKLKSIWNNEIWKKK